MLDLGLFSSHYYKKGQNKLGGLDTRPQIKNALAGVNALVKSDPTDSFSEQAPRQLPKFGAQLTHVIVRYAGREITEINTLTRMVGNLFKKVQNHGFQGVRFNNGVFEFPGSQLTFSLEPGKHFGLKERTAGVQLAKGFAHREPRFRTDGYFYPKFLDDPDQGFNFVLASGGDVIPHDEIVKLVNQQRVPVRQVFSFLEDPFRHNNQALEPLRPYSKDWLLGKTLIDPDPLPVMLQPARSVFDHHYFPSGRRGV
ncbi:MAG: hypothetical protein VKJ04_02865 [Vampirovibrionales bacterium]|nr:hypothetical protein [Vampirovibrionales bacterium]